MAESNVDTDVSSLASDSEVDERLESREKSAQPEFLNEQGFSTDGSVSDVSVGTESEDESDDEDRLKRTRGMTENLVQQHPTLIPITSQEVAERCTVRPGQDPLHLTVPFLTKYEKARVLGLRTSQLESGAVPLIDEFSPNASSYEIAVQELEKRKTPFIIMRPVPGRRAEYWRVSDLDLIC